jgi:hypothetical protein
LEDILTHKNQHVVPHERQCAVHGENSVRVTSSRRTQREAIGAAWLIARRLGGELFVHSRTGRIRHRDTTRGPDPLPPKG